MCIRDRLRIIRQLLTESALLGLLAGAVALFLSWVLLEILVVVAAQAFPAEYGTMIFHVTPDLGIFAYVFALSLVAGVLFGLAPALESSHAALSSAMKAKAGTSPVRSRRLRDFLMAAQVAVSLVLMIAGSMLIRSSIHALKMDTGYDTKQTVDLELQFPEGARYTADRKAALVRDLRERLAALPGVAAITSARAPDGNAQRQKMCIRDRTSEIPIDGGMSQTVEERRHGQQAFCYEVIKTWCEYRPALQIPDELAPAWISERRAMPRRDLQRWRRIFVRLRAGAGPV